MEKEPPQNTQTRLRDIAPVVPQWSCILWVDERKASKTIAMKVRRVKLLLPQSRSGKMNIKTSGFGSWIVERSLFMCSALVSADGF